MALAFQFRSIFAAATAILFVAAVSVATPPTEAWVARYSNGGLANNTDYASAITVDGSGNVYVTGYSSGTGTGFDYATVKYDSAGVQQWAQRYNGPSPGDDQAFAIAVDASGNVYVTGISYGGLTPRDDYATVKYNSAGVEQWASRYNGPANNTDRAEAIAVDGSGNVYVTGSSRNFIGTDYATLKYDSAGVQQWVQRYNPPGNGDDEAFAIVLDGSDNVYVTGSSFVSATSHDYATLKYNTAGVQQWVQRYAGFNGIDQAFAIALDGSGNVFVTGYSWDEVTFNDYATVKYNNAGDQQWVRRYNGPGNGGDEASAIAIDGLGNVSVTGKSYGGGTTSDDYATVKYDNAGVQQWVQRYNGPGSHTDRAKAVAVDGSGSVYVTGYSQGTSTDYATVKYDSAGVEQWVQRYSGIAGNATDEASAIAVDGSSHVYVTGGSNGGLTGTDYGTLKYVQEIGCTGVADIDNDNDVDVNDTLIFINVLLGTDTDPVRVARADANCDGLVNGKDVQTFTDILTP